MQGTLAIHFYGIAGKGEWMSEVSPKTRAAMLRRLGKWQKDFEKTYAKALEAIERERPEHVDDVLLPYAISKYCEIVSKWSAEDDGVPPDVVDVVDRALKGHQWMTKNVSVSGKVQDDGLRPLAKILVTLRNRQREIVEAQKQGVEEGRRRK
jgi:hypothetical protein